MKYKTPGPGAKPRPVPVHITISARETYYYITGARLNRRGWLDLMKRHKLVGDKIMDGNITIAYRLVRPMTEAEQVYASGRY